MGTVNGLVSGDFGPDLNTRRLKDTGGASSQRRRAVGESEGLCLETKQTRTGEEVRGRAEEVGLLTPEVFDKEKEVRK